MGEFKINQFITIFYHLLTISLFHQKFTIIQRKEDMIWMIWFSFLILKHHLIYIWNFVLHVILLNYLYIILNHLIKFLDLIRIMNYMLEFVHFHVKLVKHMILNNVRHVRNLILHILLRKILYYVNKWID